MKRVALLVVVFGSGCGVSVSPRAGDAASDAPVADGALPPCPAVFPGEGGQRCPVLGQRCAYRVPECPQQERVCVCEVGPMNANAIWRGSCELVPCS